MNPVDPHLVVFDSNYTHKEILSFIVEGNARCDFVRIPYLSSATFLKHGSAISLSVRLMTKAILPSIKILWIYWLKISLSVILINFEIKSFSKM